MLSLAEQKIKMLLGLRQTGIYDVDTLRAMELVPREHFLPPLAQAKESVYEKRTFPIGLGQTISAPDVVAIMTQACQLKTEDRVLEIGTGSGYQAAVLSHLCRRVFTIERFAPLQQSARQKLQSLHYLNIQYRHGDGYEGWPQAAPFNAIIATAAATTIPEQLLNQLAEGGRFVMPLGPQDSAQDLIRITRKEGRFVEESLARVYFVPMVEGNVEENEEYEQVNRLSYEISVERIISSS